LEDFMAAALRLIITTAMLAAASLLAGQPAVAASVDPVGFVKSLYALPQLWSSIIVTPEGRSQYLTPELASLVGGIDRKGQFRDSLDFDPLADSRPFELSDETFTLVSSDDSGATVKVDFKNYGKPDTVTLKLVSSDDGWLVEDIAFEDGRTLLDLLDYSCSG
jgi:hypothetical protein